MSNRISGNKMLKFKFGNTIRNLIACILLCFFQSSPIFGQQDGLNDLTKKFKTNLPDRFQEKLFVHIDRTFFLTGESMWFKIYLVDRNSNKLSNLSKVAYVELVTKDN